MFKYTGKYCVMSMLNRYAKPFDDWRGYIANKNNAVSFDANFAPDFPTVKYHYIYEKPSVKHYKLTQLVSGFDQEFFNLAGRRYREIRETRNKFDKIISIGNYNPAKVLDLIDRWDRDSGSKYGFQKRSGRDRNFFNQWYAKEQHNLFARFYYLWGQLIGYSVLHRCEHGYEYLLRKTNCMLRNVCLYVDYKTFEEIYKIEQQPFMVNWGASKGNLLKYKQKFPRTEETPVYFFKITNNPT